jgi:hypothetical protein
MSYSGTQPFRRHARAVARASTADLVASYRLTLRGAQRGYLGLYGRGVAQREVRVILFGEQCSGLARPVVGQLSGSKPVYSEAHSFTSVALLVSPRGYHPKPWRDHSAVVVLLALVTVAARKTE